MLQSLKTQCTQTYTQERFTLKERLWILIKGDELGDQIGEMYLVQKNDVC